MVAWRVARSLDQLRDQCDAAYPFRSTTSDGAIGDANHLAEGWQNSDHNPWYRLASENLVTARDITHDPAVGLDMDELTDQLAASRDPRIKYMIFNGWILDTRPGLHAWQWVRYHGVNPHAGHMHLSVLPMPSCDNDSPWYAAMLDQPAPPRPSSGRDLALGSRGEEVRRLQRVLNAWYPWANLIVDGIYGPATQAAVRELQARSHITVDGAVREQTRGVLNL